MSERSRAESPAAKWALWVAVALVVYVLSFGPVVAFINGPVERTQAVPFELPRPLTILYQPLIMLMFSDKEYWGDQVLSHYCQWWSRLIGPRFPGRSLPVTPE